MPYAKNSATKDKSAATVRIPDFVDEDETAPEEKTDGVVPEEADGDEVLAPEEEEELDATDLNPFGDKWEE